MIKLPKRLSVRWLFFSAPAVILKEILKIIDSTDNRLGNLSKLKSKQTEKFKVQIDTIWSVVELEIQPKHYLAP